MPEIPSNPGNPPSDSTPVPPPQPAGNGATRSSVNQAYAVSLTRVENIAKAALKPERVEVLSADGSDVTQLFLDAIVAEVAEARRLLGIAGQQTTEKEAATENGLTLEERLVRALQEVQARARQKHGAASAALGKYHIGDRLGGNRAMLEQTSQNVLTALESDPLPGITPAKIAALKTLRAQYVDSELGQTEAGGDASRARKQAKERIEALVAMRQKVQFAADAVWPWHDSGNVGVRKEFELPATRPYAA
jgi:hypothetical protein